MPTAPMLRGQRPARAAASEQRAVRWQPFGKLIGLRARPVGVDCKALLPFPARWVKDPQCERLADFGIREMIRTRRTELTFDLLTV